MRLPDKNAAKSPSTFKIVQKSIKEAINRIVRNQDILKLLYYPSSNPLAEPDLTAEQIQELLEDGNITSNIHFEAQDDKLRGRLAIVPDGFYQGENHKFRNHFLNFEILIPKEIAVLDDYCVRAWLIAGELDSMFPETSFIGIGKLHFVAATTLKLSENYGGVHYVCEATYSVEDEI